MPQLYSLMLERVATLRLARLAMMIQEEAKVHGGASASLEDYARVWGGPIPRDPYTGKGFSYERHDGVVRLGSEPWLALTEHPQSRLELLFWEVRWAPVKDGD